MKAIRWTPAVLLVAVAASVLVAVAGPWRPEPEGANADSSASVMPSTAPASEEPTPEPTPGRALRATAYAGPEYDRNLVSEPTVPAAQARLWFNDGSWWGLLVSPTTSRVTIHELNWESQRWVDTGVLVDARSFARHDVVWDGTSLIVAGAGTRNSVEHALQVSRFSYDAEARRYVLADDSPQLIAETGAEVPSLAIGPDGRVWASWVWSRALFVAHTAVDAPWSWSTPIRVPVQEEDAEVASIVGTPDGVAIGWTSLGRDTFTVASHRDADDDDAWSAESLTVDGLQYGEDELSMRATADGSILALLRTSLASVENRNLDAPQLLLVRLDGSDWHTSVVSRVRDGHTGPALFVDDGRGDVYVLAEADGGIYAKRASLDDLGFVTGRGITVIAPPAGEPSSSAEPSASAVPSAGASATPAPDLPAIEGVTSTRQDLGGLAELVVLAADDVTGRYEHAIVALPGGSEPPDAQGHLGPPPDGVQEGLPPGSVAYVFRESFTPYEVGPGTRSGWQTRSEPANELLTIAEPTPGDPSLRLLTAGTGDGPRACRPIASATTGIVQVTASIQLRGTPEGDATVTALRSDGTEVASVRFGGQGTLRYFVGDERITTAVPYALGQWYNSVVTVDLDRQTYSWAIAPLQTDSIIFQIENQPLRASAPVIDEVCAQPSNAAAGQRVALLLDDVIVAVGPGG